MPRPDGGSPVHYFVILIFLGSGPLQIIREVT
jgi:hypothetical protein